MKIFKLLLDIIYPYQPKCLYCGQDLKLPELKGLCNNCISQIEFIDNYCPLCGEKNNNNFCIYCQNKNIYYDKVRAVGYYTGILRDLILNFKYNGEIELADSLGELLYLYYQNYFHKLSIDFLLPIPLHYNRKKIRGFNQAYLLAQKLYEYSSIPLLNDYLVRVRNNPPLFQFSYKKRKELLKNIFAIKQNYSISGSTVLIIDDIFTTGSTINQASFLLKEKQKVKNVYALTLGISRKKYK